VIVLYYANPSAIYLYQIPCVLSSFVNDPEATAGCSYTSNEFTTSPRREGRFHADQLL